MPVEQALSEKKGGKLCVDAYALFFLYISIYVMWLLNIRMPDISQKILCGRHERIESSMKKSSADSKTKGS